MRKIIAIGGQPGTGKTTLVRKFMQDKDWKIWGDVKLISAMYNERNDLYVLGKYNHGEVFAGTDRLSMAVQPEIERWLQGVKSNILFEGDRIFNQSFLEYAMTLPETDLQIVYIKAPKNILEQRYKERGSNQSEVFLKGRETKYNNILSNFELMSYITVFDNTTIEEQEKILEFINQRLCIKD
jgi:broad-specificity NMP kinase